MRTYLRSILGTYTPLTTLGDGIAAVDWEYIINGLIFAIIVLFFFKMIMALFKEI